MLNWSTDEEKLKKENPREWRRWRLVQLINYGLDEGEKISRQELINFWEEVEEDLDPIKALYIRYLLWNQKPSSNQFIENFWKP